jgi:ribosome-binding ATPase YchF (GTP1/OBG family)
MRIALFGLTQLKLGNHNLRDPRLDQADQLAEAQKKTYAQVELVSDKDALTADALLVRRDLLGDVLMKDLDFIETRLSREPSDAERAVLQKLAEALMNEKPVGEAALSAEEIQTISAHNFLSSKPVVLADEADLQATDALLLRAFTEAGWICFLTVGGKENRAWPIRAGTTAWQAAGSVHTDIQKGFIRAEIISFSDFIAAGGETEAKRAGKQRLELKDYVMQDCDLANFRHAR